VDAAIIFSDILVAVEAMGAPVELTEAGPVVHAPIRSRSAVEALRVPDPSEATPYLLEAVRQTTRGLDGAIPLIGFAGGPLTLASYMVEGGSSKSYAHLKGLMFGEPRLAHALLDKVARTVTALLRAQVEAGCAAVQVFDSWAGILSPDDYRELALPYTQQIMEGLADLGVPRILFGTCTAGMLELMAESGPDVVGLDWRIDIAEARRRLGPEVALQGNLDPCWLFAPEQELDPRVERILRRARPGGHVFNLGHGVLPGTDEARARYLVEAVHRLSRRQPDA
jgi:uroporphyrinogen decarboxylase